MRVYISTCSRDYLRQAHRAAPSHVIGQCWTPKRRGFDDVPYIIDNGVYSAAMKDEEWNSEEWIDMLDRVVDRPYRPDFGVLPDVYNDAGKTIERHREWVDELVDRDIPPAFVVQPGMDEGTQVRLADRLGARFIFVGGQNRWKRAMGTKIVQEANDHDLKVHIGNPGGSDGLEWCEKIGVHSADTSTICQNQYWHYLERLEKTHLKDAPLKNGVQQTLDVIP